MSKIRAFFFKEEFANSIKQITLFSGGSFIAEVIMMIYAIVVARALGPTQLGIYSGLYATLSVSFTLVNFGFDTWMLKETPLHNSIRELTGKVLSLKLSLGFFWGIGCLILLPLSKQHFFSWFLVMLAIFEVLSDKLLITITTAWNIQGEINKLNIMLLSSRVGKLSLLFILFYINNTTPTTVFGSRLLTSAIVLMVSFIILKPIIAIANPRDMIEIIKTSYEFGLSEILAVIYGYIDIAILTFFSITSTGLYTPASGIIHALFIVPNSIYIFLLPKYANRIAKQKDVKLRSLTLKVVALFVIVGLLLSMSVFVSGRTVINIILGERFILTGEILTILSPILLLKSMSFGFALIIVITGNQRKRLLPQLLVALTNIILCVVLIPTYGILGVSWAYILSEFFLLIGYGATVFKIINNRNRIKA
jgi:O-antigen/teichoic acid export membrane protein